MPTLVGVRHAYPHGAGRSRSVGPSAEREPSDTQVLVGEHDQSTHLKIFGNNGEIRGEHASNGFGATPSGTPQENH